MSDKVWGDYDQASLNTAYNARESVPDFEGVYMPGYVNNSARARENLPGPRDVAYGPHRDQLLDIFPAKDKGAPVHLFIHGGYWRMLTKDENSFAAEAMTPAGATVMVNTYSLCPEVQLDVIVRQCRDAVVWAYKNAEKHGGDPNKLYVSGHSAGGHLAGMMLSTDWEGEYGVPADILKGVTTMSGLYDLRPLRLSFVQEWLQINEYAAERNSPLFHMPKHKCSVIVTWGGAEPKGFHDQAAAYIEALEKRGVPVTVVEMPDLDHFALGNELMDAESELTKAMIAQMGL